MPSTGLKKKTILCIDDESDILDLFCAEFQECGHLPLVATHAKKALDLLKSHHVDGLVSDIRLPGIDGVELVKRVKEMHGDLPIFLMTGFSDYTSEELSQLGVSAIVYKPFDFQEVVALVQAAILDSSTPSTRDH